HGATKSSPVLPPGRAERRARRRGADDADSHAPARDGSGGGARRPAPGAHLLRPSGGPAWCDGDGGDAPPAASEAGGPRLLLDVRRRARPETARRARGEGPPGAPGIRAAMPRLERAQRTMSRRPRCRAGASLSRSLLGAPRQRGENPRPDVTGVAWTPDMVRHQLEAPERARSYAAAPYWRAGMSLRWTGST